ncbi:YlxR family protein [Salinactinospora qingdaonensis]|uniref:YlxR domain-containing protein n=1 Tax=Salinactinospora qingdaonensis TaxID=702744 RepID=A0ABP7G8U9_9ACTN
MNQVIPIRTCVGCRSRAAQSDLLRLVRDDGGITPDHSQSAPGRGAYLHFDLRCWESAQRRRVWAKAFRVADGLDTSPVAAYFAAAPSVRDGQESR